MRSSIVTRLHKNFEDYVHVQDGVKFWFARDIQNLLGYSEWRNFLKVIEKARESCKTSNHAISDRFVDVNKSISLYRKEGHGRLGISCSPGTPVISSPRTVIPAPALSSFYKAEPPDFFRVTCVTLRVISGNFFLYNSYEELPGKRVQCDTSDTTFMECSPDSGEVILGSVGTDMVDV